MARLVEWASRVGGKPSGAGRSLGASLRERDPKDCRDGSCTDLKLHFNNDFTLKKPKGEGLPSLGS